MVGAHMTASLYTAYVTTPPVQARQIKKLRFAAETNLPIVRLNRPSVSAGLFPDGNGSGGVSFPRNLQRVIVTIIQHRH